MSQAEFFNIITNALGNPHFSEQEVQDALRIQIDQMRAAGKNPGSLISIANLQAALTDVRLHPTKFIPNPLYSKIQRGTELADWEKREAQFALLALYNLLRI